MDKNLYTRFAEIGIDESLEIDGGNFIAIALAGVPLIIPIILMYAIAFPSLFR